VLAEQEDAAVVEGLGVAVRQPQVRAPRTAQVLHIFDQKHQKFSKFVNIRHLVGFLTLEIQ
jgi:hypothetical protein